MFKTVSEEQRTKTYSEELIFCRISQMINCALKILQIPTGISFCKFGSLFDLDSHIIFHGNLL